MRPAVGEIRRPGDLGERLHPHMAQGGFVELEFSVVAGKNQCTVRPQMFQCQIDQRHMISLDLKYPFPVLGIGKSGRIDKDQTVPVLLPLQPLQAIVPHQLMTLGADSIEG